jgi:hypothetical protein
MYIMKKILRELDFSFFTLIWCFEDTEANPHCHLISPKDFEDFEVDKILLTSWVKSILLLKYLYSGNIPIPIKRVGILMLPEKN